MNEQKQWWRREKRENVGEDGGVALVLEHAGGREVV